MSTIWRSKSNQTLKFGHVIEYNKIIFFFKNYAKNEAGELNPDLFLFFRKALYEVKASILQLNFNIFQWSSLIYNTSARHERHECDTSDTSETRETRMRHKCDTSATRTTRVRHECYTNDRGATRVKNFDFDNDTNKNIFLHPYTYYVASERLQGEETFHSKN